MGGTTLSKCFIQFSVDGRGCVIYLMTNCVGGNEIMETSRRRSHDALLHSLPQPCSRPPPTHTSAGDPWTPTGKSGQPLVGSLLLSPESRCPQAMFEPSERLWWVWGLTLNVISLLLPSFWGFSALGRGVSPHGRFKFDHTRGIFPGYERDKQ